MGVLGCCAPVAVAQDTTEPQRPAPSPERPADGPTERPERRLPPPEPVEAPEEEEPLLPRPEADFLRRDIDLKFRIGFNGSSPGPFSLFSALGGWNEFSLAIDAGAMNWRAFTIGFGGTIYYGQAGILGASTQRISNYEDIQFRWQMWESGGVFRTTFHYTALSSIDPYLFGGIGAEAFQLTTRVRGWPFIDAVDHTTGSLRIEAGGGINGRLKGSRWIIGGELRYIIAVPFRGTEQLVLEDETQSATFVLFPQHNPSRGFSWVIQAGYRF